MDHLTADVQTMESLVDFAYSGNIQLNNGNIERITIAANLFGIPTLLKKCVEYIKSRLNTRNCIEVLELSDHISNKGLRDSAMQFIISEFKTIAVENLDILEMSFSLLLEIIGHNATLIEVNPEKNEERLFQIGWSNLHSKTDAQRATFLPRLLKAVHLPQTSDSFLYGVWRKVEHCEEASILVEEAKLRKKAVKNYKATAECPEIDGSVIWQMARFESPCQISVTCHGLKVNSTNTWFGAPALMNGTVWCISVTTGTSTENGPPEKYLSAYLYCLSKGSQSITIECKFELHVPPDNSSERSPVLAEYTETFYENSPASRGGYFVKLSDVLAGYYDAENDSFTLDAHLTEVEVKENEDGDDF